MFDDPRWEKGESDAHIIIQVEGSRKGKFFYEHAVPLKFRGCDVRHLHRELTGVIDEITPEGDSDLDN